MRNNLIKKVQNIFFRENLLERGQKILVAVSGGPDSACLLDVLATLQKKYHFKLGIAHVNYHLRGSESDKDEKLVRTLAEKYDIELFLMDSKVSPKSNIESELRDIRYDFFERLRDENGFDSIAVAHNMDDQVETFLMRLIRGSGLNGLRAMRFRNGNIIRPLLGISRKEILEYLKSNKLPCRIDKSNMETKFTRNKVRHKLIPYLEKNFNPGIRKTVFDAAQSISDDYDLLSSIPEGISTGDKASVKEILKLSPSAQKRFLRKMILERKKDLKNIESSHIEEILKALRSTKGKIQTINLPGLKIQRKGDRITLE
ncbi:MAG: tRNA lysidine(34) synthetase TilS [Candidatus Moranbacteria bacterium]|nr:tRNA lysidine(34) synthetase TilS [Candidatus Moranbacteria bacterium]